MMALSQPLAICVRMPCEPLNQRLPLPTGSCAIVLKRQCCNFQAAAHERYDAGIASDCNLEQPSDEMELAHNLTDAYPPDLPLPNRMHGFVTLNRADGCAISGGWVGDRSRRGCRHLNHPPSG